ncbi:MAG: hypothetical protein A2804_00410 [Candidatus Pacebacteria bacterium RIFCSPHIGHO2_01_FULL_46_10]|nr:MAG: hypothetical protein A2804_00410 [Candidatus Pacebacteria bacterium RIFCSPHIGHO2_01_FULL_46_10]
MKKLLSIVIVSYKNFAQAQVLKQNLSKEKRWECVIVDNTTHNRGYGTACNEGARQTRGEYLLFLNADVEITIPAVKKMIAYMEKHKNVGVVGPQFLNAEGSIEQSSTKLPTPSVAAVALSFLNTLFPNTSVSENYWLKTWDRTTTREVDVVSGAAMLVRRNDFICIGGFDHQFFLYWEEFDLCARMKQIGKRVVFLADARAYHPRQISVRLAQREGLETHQYFTQSRFRYFKKYFGLIQATLLEFWLTVTEQWRFFFILALSFFLRTYDLLHIPVIGDVGRDYLRALSLLRLQSFDLLGIPSSIPRFAQGPFNIWFDALSFLFGGVSVFAPPLFAAVLTTMGIGLLYILLEKRIGKTPAFLGALLMAGSPMEIIHSRMPFYLFAVPVFTLLYLFALERMETVKTRWSVFFAVLSFGVLFQWELAVIPLSGLLVWQGVKRRNICLKYWKFALGGAVLGFLPQILYDLTHRCAQLCRLVAWTGYRTVAVTGFDERHGMTLNIFTTTFIASAEQLKKLIGWNEYISLIGVGIIIFFGLYVSRKRRLPHLVLYSLLGFILMGIGVVIHGSPSEAYFPQFSLFLAILFGYGVSRITSKYVRWLVILGIVVLIAKNGTLLIQNHFYTSSIVNSIEAAQWVVRDASGQPIRFVSYDTGAVFPTYLDNIRFLSTIRGGRIGDGGVLYIVSFEKDVVLPSVDVEKRVFGDVTIVKNLVGGTVIE